MRGRSLCAAFASWAEAATAQQDDVDAWHELLDLEASDCLYSHFSAWNQLLLTRDDRLVKGEQELVYRRF